VRGYAIALDVPAQKAYEILKERGTFPPGRTWWFAWREDRIALPSILDNEEVMFQEPWDVLRVFASLAELRLVYRRGRQTVSILTEDEGLGVLQLQGRQEKFAVAENGKRILWGERMRLLGQESRGVVAFPRYLSYLDNDDLTKACIATVVEYRDEEYILKAVRYKGLHLEEPTTWSLSGSAISADFGGW